MKNEANFNKHVAKCSKIDEIETDPPTIDLTSQDLINVEAEKVVSSDSGLVSEEFNADGSSVLSLCADETTIKSKPDLTSNASYNDSNGCHFEIDADKKCSTSPQVEAGPLQRPSSPSCTMVQLT